MNLPGLYDQEAIRAFIKEHGFPEYRRQENWHRYRINCDYPRKAHTPEYHAALMADLKEMLDFVYQNIAHDRYCVLAGTGDGNLCLEFDYWEDWDLLLIQESPGSWYFDVEDGYPSHTSEDSRRLLLKYLDEYDAQYPRQRPPKPSV